MEEEKIDYIFLRICDEFVNLSLNANGLCVIKKIIQKFKK